ncbi:hypothetical protein [Burkholderia ambifaria]|uniref:Uncharacterized protein n=1 Tax=Burkholderia ambifaria MEX-5 TaxID=396597 RepID=B1SX31_9BURK|nr:hypothetical protein [Burkholderia ambifaria]EDT44089.1 hypothetical protein BamMEX5DRAFT_0104 [Burkholderia ambifaria MEX-5]
MRLAGFEREPQRLAFAQQVRLADHLGERLGPQRLGERPARLDLKQVGHEPSLQIRQWRPNGPPDPIL